MSSSDRVIYTFGHSSRTLEDALRVLQAHSIEQLVDIRAFPASRRLPHFNREPLQQALEAAGIAYSHMPALGGRRPKSPGPSPNTAWEHSSFRNYADYAMTPQFSSALDGLEELARSRRTAIMCAEAVPWRCHRRIVADYLQMVRGWEVRDILSDARADPHQPPPFAVPSGSTVVYPDPQQSLPRQGE